VRDQDDVVPCASADQQWLKRQPECKKKRGATRGRVTVIERREPERRARQERERVVEK
jgi:hypothetical protein